MVRMIVIDGGTKDVFSLIKVEKFGVCEVCEIGAKVEVLGLLRRKIVFRGYGVEVGEVMGNVGTLATTAEASHDHNRHPVVAQWMLQLRRTMVS